MSQTRYILTNNCWDLEIENNQNGFTYKLHSILNDVTYADEDYHYRILTSKKKGS